MWTTGVRASAGADIFVCGASRASARHFDTDGEPRTYAAADMCNAPATTKGFIDPGFQHVVTFTGLKPASCYSYVLADDATSRVVNFTTAPREDVEQVEFAVSCLPLVAVLAQERA